MRNTNAGGEGSPSLRPRGIQECPPPTLPPLRGLCPRNAPADLPKKDFPVYNLAAFCAAGTEKVLSNELFKMGIKTAGNASFGKVLFSADLEGIYKALIGLRTADRVLLVAASIPDAKDFDVLFDGVSAVPWEKLIPQNIGVKIVKVRSHASQLAAETSIQAVTHKAIAKRLCDAYHISRLPDFSLCAEVRVHIERDHAEIMLDLSGEPLFKRGYRIAGGDAPLRETTAAAIILLSLWKRKLPLYDPFCGSGTIVIEAAMYAWNMAPNIGRRFALCKLGLANGALEKKVRAAFLSGVNFENTIRIYASDRDSAALENAQSNLRRAYALAQGISPNDNVLSPPEFVPALPRFKCVSFEDAVPPEDTEPGLVLTNPPYGRRLGDRTGAEETYRKMAALRSHFPSWRIAVITDHEGFESHFGAKASSCKEITNGAVKTYLYQY